MPEAEAKRRVLFLCTHNSARSQMAEGLLSALGGEHFEVFSAETEATAVRPLAVRAMAELGIVCLAGMIWPSAERVRALTSRTHGRYSGS